MFFRYLFIPVRYINSTRLLCTTVRKKPPRKRGRITKELVPASIVDFSQLFDCPYPQAYKILQKHNTLRDFTVDHLQKSINACEKVGIDKADILDYPDVLAIHPSTVKQHSMLLKEGGFSFVDAHTLINYIPVSKKRISLLKAYGYIPSEVKLPQHFLSHLEEEAQALTFPRNYSDSETSFIEASNEALCLYLCWRFQTHPEQLNKVMKTYARLKHKSFRLIKTALDILEADVGFTKEKIMKNGFLIHCDPHNLKEILSTFTDLGGIPIREVIIKHPKICMTNAETITAILRHLKSFSITDEAVRRCPEIFTLSSKSIHERLSHLQVVPEFSVLMGHPRILRLVHYQNKARTRLDFLHNLKMKCVSLHVLSTATCNFERYTKEGADKTKGTDISQFLSQELGYSEQVIRLSLQRHPYWCHVPLVSIRETLKFLLISGFTKQQIVSSIHVLLYPKERVERELESLVHHPEVAAENLIPLGKSWTYDPVKSQSPQELSAPSVPGEDSSSDEDDLEVVPRDSDWRVPAWQLPSDARRDLRLDFCMYFLEKKHHFTGDGIWGDAQPSDLPSASKELPPPPLKLF